MVYTVTHNPEDVKQFAKNCVLYGQPMPDFIKNAPELWPGLEIYLQAFWDLSTCRQMGMGLGPIPWTSIQNWCTINDVSSEFRRDLEFHVRRLDQAYLKWANETSTKDTPK